MMMGRVPGRVRPRMVVQDGVGRGGGRGGTHLRWRLVALAESRRSMQARRLTSSTMSGSVEEPQHESHCC